MLFTELHKNFFTKPESIAICVELVGTFEEHALLLGYEPWESVDFHGRRDFVQQLSKSYKTVRVAADVDSSSLSTVQQNPDKLAMQRWTTAKAPMIDFVKTNQTATADAFVSKLCLSKKPIGDSS